MKGIPEAPSINQSKKSWRAVIINLSIHEKKKNEKRSFEL